MVSRSRIFSIAIVLAANSIILASANAQTDRVTFTKDVLPLLQENCQACHRQGGDNLSGMVAPMSLTNYQEVRPWAKAIVKAIVARDMPPWDATAHTDGQFENERRLTDAEITTIVNWVETGAARGNPSDAPKPVPFGETDGWYMGEPDLIVPIESIWVGDDVEDWQPRFTMEVTAEMLPEPRWIQAVEMRHGSEVVHHMIASASAPAVDGHPAENFLAGSNAAGEEPTMYPEGFGNLLRAGTKLNGSMHYHKEVGPGTGVWDQSLIGFKFHPPEIEIKYKVMRNGIGTGSLGNGSFDIPPHHADWHVGSSKTFDEPTVLISLHPHMHYRGKSMIYTAYYPDGNTEVLLDVDRYDYAWQTQYIYKSPKYIPKGTRIDVIATFDNSETIKEQVPSLNIERAVDFGAASTDEMMIPWAEWSTIEPDDIPDFLPGALQTQD
ncbi:MAG: c-type cytochrome [Candidatus Hydrogenedentota bacterium]|jgi:mono/diheme cytochrome c family protein